MRNYQYLVAVATHGHFGKAADECCVTQPTLSLGIKELERQLGFNLVHREHRYMGLTGEGEIVVAYAKRMEKLRASLTTTLEQYRNHQESPLVFGTVQSGVDIVAYLATRLSQLDLSQSFATETVSRDDVVRAVMDGDMDLGITHLDLCSSELHVLARLSDDEAFIVAPKSMSLDTASVSIDDIRQLPLCHLSIDNYDSEIQSCLSADKLTAGRPRICAGSARSVVSHLGQQYWYAVVPRGVLGAINKDGQFWAKPVTTGVACPTLAIVSRPISTYYGKKLEIIEHLRKTALQYVQSQNDIFFNTANVPEELKCEIVPPHSGACKSRYPH